MVILEEGLRKFIVPYEYYKFTNRALGLVVKRSDGVIVPGLTYFPISQIKVSDPVNGRIVVEIPDWLLKEKLISGFKIAEIF